MKGECEVEGKWKARYLERYNNFNEGLNILKSLTKPGQRTSKLMHWTSYQVPHKQILKD